MTATIYSKVTIYICTLTKRLPSSVKTKNYEYVKTAYDENVSYEGQSG